MPKMNEDINAVRYNLGMKACLFGAKISPHLAAAKCCVNDAIGQASVEFLRILLNRPYFFHPHTEKQSSVCLYS